MFVERKREIKNNFYLFLTNTKKWKTSPNENLARVAYVRTWSFLLKIRNAYLHRGNRNIRGGALESAPRVNSSETHHCVIVTQ